MKDEKRAATVIAQEPGVECLTLDRIHFIEYLGGLQEVRDANFDKKVSLEKNNASGIIIIIIINNKILKKIFCFVLETFKLSFRV